MRNVCNILQQEHGKKIDGCGYCAQDDIENKKDCRLIKIMSDNLFRKSNLYYCEIAASSSGV